MCVKSEDRERVAGWNMFTRSKHSTHNNNTYTLCTNTIARIHLQSYVWKRKKRKYIKTMMQNVDEGMKKNDNVCTCTHTQIYTRIRRKNRRKRRGNSGNNNNNNANQTWTATDLTARIHLHLVTHTQNTKQYYENNSKSKRKALNVYSPQPQTVRCSLGALCFVHTRYLCHSHCRSRPLHPPSAIVAVVLTLSSWHV